jgi:hypothetical protein
MKCLVFVSLAALTAASPAGAKAMKWMDGSAVGLPPGSQLAVVSGDPTKAGMFVVRAKMPANYTVPPHHHPSDEKVSVKSGGPLSYGMGDKMDPANAGTLNKGYHVTMQAQMNHWVMASAPTEIEVTGMGPFQITYVNPADDPRNKK